MPSGGTGLPRTWTCFLIGRVGTGLGSGPLQHPPRCSGPAWPVSPRSIWLSRQPRILDPCEKQILCQPSPGLSIKSPHPTRGLRLPCPGLREAYRGDGIGPFHPCPAPSSEQAAPWKGGRDLSEDLGNMKQSADPLPCQFSPLPSVGARITKKLPLMCLLWLIVLPRKRDDKDSEVPSKLEGEHVLMVSWPCLHDVE